MTVDYITGIISGIKAGEVSLEPYFELADEKYSWSYENSGRLGTGTKAFLMNGEEVIGEYTILLYGDVSGDGWYDGEDAVIVTCLTKNMFGQDSFNEVYYMAADCNHNGSIDVTDVKLLNDAGLLLASVDQSQTAEVLFETSSDYIAYIDIIEQSVEPGNEAQQDPEDAVNDTEKESENAENPWSIIDILISFIKAFISIFLKLW